MEKSVGYYVLRALVEKLCFHCNDERLRRHIKWLEEFKELCVNNNENEKRAYEIVLSGDYERYLTVEHKGHKVVYISQECLEIDGRKIKIVQTYGYVFKLQKTQVKAMYGAIGLLANCFGDVSDWEALGDGLCEVIKEKTKEMKQNC